MGNLKNEHNNKTETFLDYKDKYLVANRGQDQSRSEISEGD